MVQKVIAQTGGADAQADALKQKILNAENALPEITGNTYYVSCDGDDANDGLTPETAIKTYNHIAKLPLKAGDQVLLRRGDIFRITEMLWLIDGVNYGAYGEGEKPRVYGSLRNYADGSIWKQSEQNPNIWLTEIHGDDRGAIITFNDDEYVGVWKYKIEDLENDGDYAHDEETGMFGLYFEEGNPGDYFEEIEIGTTEIAMRTAKVAGHKDIHIDNIFFKYFTFGAFQTAEPENMKITNCICGWQGGKIWNLNDPGGIKQFGNAIQFWWQCKNVLVKNCWVYQVWDAAITFQGCGDEPAYFENITYEENIVEYCCMNIEFWGGKRDGSEKPAHFENITYKGNMVRFAGYGWGGIQRWDKHCQAMLLGWDCTYEDMNNFVIKDNIFDTADCYMIWTPVPDKQEGLFVYDNTYYQKQGTGNNPNMEVVCRYDDSFANNQEELEKAVSIFDKQPKLVKWLDK